MNRIEKIGLIGLIGLVGLIGGCRAQASLEADTIVLGDQTTVSLPAGVNLLPSEGVQLLRQTQDSVTGGMQAVVTSFEPGDHWLKVGDDSLLLVVTDVEVDTSTAEIRDIAPIERVPYTFWEIFRWVLLALVIIAIGVAVWWVLTHRQKVQQVLGLTEPVDTRNPHERAVEAMEALREQRLWQAGKVKEYHTELTDIVRRFIEEATGIRATDMTSDETVEAVASGQWSVDGGLLRSLFATADMVKFAKSEPLPHEHEASLKAAVEFVDALWEQVKPREAEGKEAGDKEIGGKEL